MKNIKRSSTVFLNIYLIYLFGCAGSQLWRMGASLWHVRSFFSFFLKSHAEYLVAAGELLVVAQGSWFPDQGSHPGPLHWEHGALVMGPLGTSSEACFF